jgi:hypothetical protein
VAAARAPRANGVEAAAAINAAVLITVRRVGLIPIFFSPLLGCEDPFFF